MPNNSGLYWKVCGMKDAGNVRDVAQLQPDFMGFIFYEKSPRYMAAVLLPEHLDVVDRQTKRVGVFVDPALAEVEKYSAAYSLDLIQLHGNESVDFIEKLNGSGYKIIKVVSGNKPLDVKYMKQIEPLIEFWLLDTRTEVPGGTGKVFDRKVLDTFEFEKPVILSGGLDPDEVNKIRKEGHSAVVGIDVNSKMEDAPGMKNLEKLNKLIACLN